MAANQVGLLSSLPHLPLPLLPDAPEPSTVQIHPSPAKEGKSVELICVSLANPPAKNYTWHHNGDKILEETEEKFQISSVSLEHAGRYSCLAENIYGHGQSGQGAELDVQCEQLHGLWLLGENREMGEEGGQTEFRGFLGSWNKKQAEARASRHVNFLGL